MKTASLSGAASAEAAELPLGLSWSEFKAARRRLNGESVPVTDSPPSSLLSSATCQDEQSPAAPLASDEQPFYAGSFEKGDAAGSAHTLVGPAPIKYSRWLSQAVGGSVWLKLECLHEGGSFKLRGATHALLAHRDRHHGRLPSRVYTASGGNHGLGVAIAAQRLGVPCTIVLPTNTPQHRCKVIASYGAEVKLIGDVWDSANAEAVRMASEAKDALYIHPFAETDVILGQGTIAMELLEQMNVDNVVASVGGGGLMSGIVSCYRVKGDTQTKFYAVETEGADWFYQSSEAGQLVTLPTITSIAKTLGAKSSTPEVYQILSRNVERALRVSDKEAVEALVSFLDREKLLVEPAAACVVAAVLKNPDLFAGKSTVLIVCGSNTTLDEVSLWRQQFNIAADPTTKTTP